jgi:carbonic anhydrase
MSMPCWTSSSIGNSRWRAWVDALIVTGALLGGAGGAWAQSQTLCERGQRQSPIDIVSTRPQAAQPLRFDYRSAPLRLVHDGHTVRVRVPPGSRLMWGAESLSLQQFHFHVPGGDRVHGEDFPMAMHFAQAEEAVVGVVVDPARWLPAAHGYYAYDGSVTAPPCTEGVRWIVMKQPQTLSAAQLQRLKQLFADNARPVQPLNGRVVTESP